MFWPFLTMSAVSELGRRQRSAFFALSKAVSIAFGAAPSMAWDSIRLPPQSSTAMATVVLWLCAHCVQPSTRPRAPDELMTFIVRNGAGAAAKLSALMDAIRSAAKETSERRARMGSLPDGCGDNIKVADGARGAPLTRESARGARAFLPSPPVFGP